MKFRLRFGIVAGALVLSAAFALAQAGRGSISGLVSDPTGAIVNGAQVTALNHATSVAQDNVPVTVDQVSTVNIALRVGNVAETVEVTATPELVDTSNSTVGQLI